VSHYKPYPAYKDSGVEWLGRVPEHWDVMAIKHVVATPITDGPHETPEFFDDGVPFVSAEAVSSGKIDFDKIRGFISRIDHDRYSQKYLPKRGDIFMIKSGATTGVTAIVETDVEFNIWSPLAVIRCAARSNPYFVLNYMRSRSFQEAVALSWSYGTQQNIGMGVIGDLSVTVPPVEEQQAIADHLDRETARIDALIEKKTRFIKLLREKRQALITHAVTKGLDPNVKMKDSGVEWLGEVPEHWSFGRLAYACELIVDGTHHSPESHPEGAFKYITAKNIKEHGFDFTELTYVSVDQHQEIYNRCSVKTGDVLYIKDGATAGIAMVNRLDEEFSLLSSVAVIRPKKKRLISVYLAYLLNSGGFKTSVLSQLVGGAITRFTLEMIGNFSVSLPPIEEQRQVVVHLEGMIPRLDVLNGKTERSIDLLKERRAALITAAVTGQIDLRDAV